MENKITIDIHGMTTTDAKHKLERLITGASADIAEITVIHGYSGGNMPGNMVRKTLKHKRIKQRILSLNRGETILVLTE